MKRKIQQFVFVLICLVAGFAPAATRTWTGLAGDGLWTSKRNWEPNDAAPAVDDDVVLGEAAEGETIGITSGSGVHCKSLTVEANVILTPKTYASKQCPESGAMPNISIAEGKVLTLSHGGSSPGAFFNSISGPGTLRVACEKASNLVRFCNGTLDNLTIDIVSGKVTLGVSGGGDSSALNNVTFILHEGAILDNYHSLPAGATMTFVNDDDVEVFTSGYAQSTPINVTKRGKGELSFAMIVANLENTIVCEEGTFLFSANSAMTIKGTLSGAGRFGARKPTAHSVKTYTFQSENTYTGGFVAKLFDNVTPGLTLTGDAPFGPRGSLFRWEGTVLTTGAWTGYFVELLEGGSVSGQGTFDLEKAGELNGLRILGDAKIATRSIIFRPGLSEDAPIELNGHTLTINQTSGSGNLLGLNNVAVKDEGVILVQNGDLRIVEGKGGMTMDDGEFRMAGGKLMIDDASQFNDFSLNGGTVSGKAVMTVSGILAVGDGRNLDCNLVLTEDAVIRLPATYKTNTDKRLVTAGHTIQLPSAFKNNYYYIGDSLIEGSLIFNPENGTVRASPSQATTWTGGATGDWDVASNWSSGSVPNAAGEVIIDSDAEITMSESSAAGSVAIKANVTFRGPMSEACFAAGATVTEGMTLTLVNDTENSKIVANYKISGEGALAIEGAEGASIELAANVNDFKGGLFVNSGTAVCGHTNSFGETGNTRETPHVTVAEGATISFATTMDSRVYWVACAGTIQAPAGQEAWHQIYRLTLTGDAVMKGKSFGLVNTNLDTTILEMNGHTLTIDLDDANQRFWFNHTEVQGEGQIYVKTGGIKVTPRAAVVVQNATLKFDPGTTLQLANDMTVPSIDAVGATIKGYHFGETLTILGEANLPEGYSTASIVLPNADRAIYNVGDNRDLSEYVLYASTEFVVPERLSEDGTIHLYGAPSGANPLIMRADGTVFDAKDVKITRPTASEVIATFVPTLTGSAALLDCPFNGATVSVGRDPAERTGQGHGPYYNADKTGLVLYSNIFRSYTLPLPMTAALQTVIPTGAKRAFFSLGRRENGVILATTETDGEVAVLLSQGNMENDGNAVQNLGTFKLDKVHEALQLFVFTVSEDACELCVYVNGKKKLTYRSAEPISFATEGFSVKSGYQIGGILGGGLSGYVDCESNRVDTEYVNQFFLYDMILGPNAMNALKTQFPGPRKSGFTLLVR